MTTPQERGRSVYQAAKFLENLGHGVYKGAPKHLRTEALRLLRHYPWEIHLEEISQKCPDVLEFHHER